MKPSHLKALRALDLRYQAMQPYERFIRPPKGWIRAVRDALGMTSTQLAARIGIAQPTLQDYERREMEDAITLKSLQKAARAMNCRLIYAIVPEDSLNSILWKQAERRARAMFDRVDRSMNLEQQRVTASERDLQLQALIQQWTDNPTRLWDEHV
ncbi:MAG: mobile mystery protein A [Candidatus Melainabacteria bacterium]